MAKLCGGHRLRDLVLCSIAALLSFLTPAWAAVPLPGGVTSRFLGLGFDTSTASSTTAPTDTTLSATGTLAVSSTGGVDGAGFATGWSTSNYLSFATAWSADKAGDADRTFLAWYKGEQLHSCAAGGGNSWTCGVPVFGELSSGYLAVGSTRSAPQFMRSARRRATSARTSWA